MFEKVREIIVDNLSCDTKRITMDASLAEDLELDSLDVVILNASLEEGLGFCLTNEALAESKTVGDIVHYMEQLDAQEDQ